MSNPSDLHVSFRHQGTLYNIDLVRGEKSNQSIQINGVSYTVLGNRERLEAAYQILSSLGEISSSQDLRDRLSLREDISFPEGETVNNVGVKSLKTKATPLPVPQTIDQAYKQLVQQLDEYAKQNIGQGALLVQVVGLKGAENPMAYGQLSVRNTARVDGDTIGRTGSGAKLWAGLLSTIVTRKYPQHIKMDDKFGKFAPNEALRKFGKLSPEGPEVAQEMTLEAIVGMTAGLEYEYRSPIESSSATLDEIMRGSDLENGSIHLLHDPRDGISVYSNNISLTAYPLEKAYKKVRADQLVAQGKLNKNQTLRELAKKVEPLRIQLNKQIGKEEQKLENLRGRQKLAKSLSGKKSEKSSLSTQIDVHEKRLEGLRSDLKKLPPSIPQSVLDITLKDLLESDSAYIGPDQGTYVYDLIDQFLMQFDPETLSTTDDHRISYDDIIKRELLDPMGMSHSGFYGTKGKEMDVTFVNPTTTKQQSKAPPHENVMLHAAGGGRTTLNDASKLAQGLANKQGLVGKDGEVLLSQDDLQYVFSPHGHYKGWGIGGSELSCNGQFIEKGGSFDQDTYTFWIDRSSGVGLIAMCNCGKRPVRILENFKEQVKKISHPDAQDVAREKEETPIGLTLSDYSAHPLTNPKEYYEGTRGKIALLFDPSKEDEGIMHWSGTPLHLEKQDDDVSGKRKFRITTPGRFENVEVWKEKGAYVKNQDYLAVGDTSFIRTSTDNIPSDKNIADAKGEFRKFAGDYKNPQRPEWGIFRFDVKGEGDDIYLCACELEKENEVKASVPLGIIKVEPNAISFNGHDRQPPDKIFRFVRASENAPWRVQITDVASPESVIEERTKIV